MQVQASRGEIPALALLGIGQHEVEELVDPVTALLAVDWPGRPEGVLGIPTVHAGLMQHPAEIETGVGPGRPVPHRGPRLDACQSVHQPAQRRRREVHDRVVLGYLGHLLSA